MPAVTVDRAETFIGVPVPEGATQVRAAGEEGRDQLVLLGFEVDDQTARDYASLLLGTTPVPGDPGLLYLGEGLPWWPHQLPPSAVGGESRRDDNRTIKLLLAPAPNHPTRVFVAAFTQ